MSSWDHLKNPVAMTLQAVAGKKTTDADLLSGKTLPCSVAEVVSSGIVKVRFEVSGPWTIPEVTVPILAPEYVRYPIQVGDKGLLIPADVLLGGLSGLGSGTPSLQSTVANLGGLAFLWLGSAQWSAPTDPRAVEVYGPNGVILRDTGSVCTLTLTPGGVVIGGTTGDLAVLGNLSAGNGYTGAVPTGTGQTVIFQGGVCVNVH